MGTTRELNFPQYVFGGDSSIWDDVNETPSRPDFATADSRGWEFDIARASFGLMKDSDFDINWENKTKTTLLQSAYHFLVWDQSPERQAEFFWNIVKDKIGTAPLFCDFEWWSTIPADAFDRLYCFLERLKQLTPGRKLGIYTAKGFWDYYGRIDPYWKQYLLWLAHWDFTPPINQADIPLPWTKVDFWQFTGHGDGLYYGMESKDVDLDYFMGTKSELLTLFGKTGENMTDYTKSAIGFYTKTANWSAGIFQFIIGHAGESWNEPNVNLKAIETKAVAENAVFGALWDFDVDYYSYGQYMGQDQYWPKVENDVPLQKCLDAIRNRDIKFMVVRVMTPTSIYSGKVEDPAYISYAASTFMGRLNDWLKVNKPNVKLIICTNNEFISKYSPNMNNWAHKYPTMVYQLAKTPLLAGAYPQETDKVNYYISTRPTNEFWYYYDSSSVDLVLFYGGLRDKAAFYSWMGIDETPVDTEKPSTPTGLVATVDEHTVSVNWNASTDNVGVKNYEVALDANVFTTTNISYTFANVANGIHMITVVAVDNAGNKSLAATTTVTVSVAQPPTDAEQRILALENSIKSLKESLKPWVNS